MSNDYLRLVDYGALFTFLIFISLSIGCCTWCYCIRAHDKAMQHYVTNLAKQKGLQVEPYTIHTEPCCRSPHANENCSIFVPDVGVIL
ncbi:hypothetical protein RR46_01153 [Papilio xuthus]|uniref:Uncharacterized protein n=1 Tax=Papilio xuthus TaxID=66420 RepID=A0A0N1I5R5_PAPXU|nr:hypothetical protein RR46_01153 [Papilio xuthus]